MFLDSSTPLAFAHRGFAPDGAENSMAAFAAAIALGYRYLETDARVSADGVAFAFHDDALDRVTDAEGPLSRLDAATIGRARIAGTEPVPLLEDVLGAWPDARFNVDVKSDGAVAATVTAIKRTRATDRVCLAAFSDARLLRLRNLLPSACSSTGPREVAALAAMARLPRRRRAAVRLKPSMTGRCVQVPVGFARFRLVDRRLLDLAHEAGAVVHVWTVDDPAAMTDLLDLGVDGIMTDRADLLRDVLRGRGEWPDQPPLAGPAD